MCPGKIKKSDSLLLRQQASHAGNTQDQAQTHHDQVGGVASAGVSGGAASGAASGGRRSHNSLGIGDESLFADRALVSDQGSIHVSGVNLATSLVQHKGCIHVHDGQLAALHPNVTGEGGGGDATGERAAVQGDLSSSSTQIQVAAPGAGTGLDGATIHVHGGINSNVAAKTGLGILDHTAVHIEGSGGNLRLGGIQGLVQGADSAACLAGLTGIYVMPTL